jgi:antitoxin HigA-1
MDNERDPYADYVEGPVYEAEGPFALEIHPGEVLLGLHLEPKKLSVAEAAAALGTTRQTLSAIVAGRRSITPEMALRLERAFGVSAESWLGMQKNYDLARARARVDVSQIPVLAGA